MTIRQTRPDELEKILKFYKACRYSGGVTLEDLIVCAEKDKKIIAVVRLCNENQTFVLRGMKVDKKFQRQGIGKALLIQLGKIIGHQTCFCIPYEHLENFYSTIGFKKIEAKKIPKHLLKRLERYKLKDPNMIIMKR